MRAMDFVQKRKELYEECEDLQSSFWWIRESPGMVHVCEERCGADK